MNREADPGIIERITRLRQELHRHDLRYFVLDDPVISDAQYDRLMQELISLESQWPELASSDSPSARVGGAPLDRFETVEHEPPMLSLDKGFSDADFRAFDERVRKGLGSHDPVHYTAEPKIDGVAVELVYEEGSSDPGIHPWRRQDRRKDHGKRQNHPNGPPGAQRSR
jgi:DNA ligase (NAD+)